MPPRSTDDVFADLDRPADRPVHPAALPDEALLSACVVTHTRTGGPGGQHRNKTNSGVALAHTPTGIASHATERRSAEENKRVALRRLRLELAVRHREPVPAGEIRSQRWRERTRTGRILLSAHHHDYPALLAEALDVLHACAYDARRAATRLGVSPTQLIRMIGDHPHALGAVNEQRRLRGEHELKA